MGKRFEVGVAENMEMIVIKDKRTEEVRVRCFKSEEDLSFLEAIRDAAQELLDTLKTDTSNDTVEVVKGDNKLFPTGLKFKVVRGKVSYFSGDLAKDVIALTMFGGFTFKSFEELSELLNKIYIKVKEVKEGEE